MPIYKLTENALQPLPVISFSQYGIRERGDLQRLLKTNISVVVPDVLVIAEEFSEWEGSRRRIDLLGIDRLANLVVIELKRDDEGGHMELQAIRYAAMVSAMTFARAVQVFQSFLDDASDRRDAQEVLLDFLEWEEPREDAFAQDVRIVLVSADFSKELTTAVLWLNQRELDIQCVRLRPYSGDNGVLIDAQRIIPLPEASEYQSKLRQKAVEQRQAVRESGEDTGYWFMNCGDDGTGNGRTWEDCKKYGFIAAGGGKKWQEFARKLRVGDMLFAYLTGFGYVGLGEVVAEAVPFKDYLPKGHSATLPNLPLTARIAESIGDPEEWDLCVEVNWVKAVDRSDATLKNLAYRGTLNRMRKPELVAELLKFFEPQS